MILDSNININLNFAGYGPLLDWLKNPEVSLRVSAISAIEVLGYPKLATQDKADLELLFDSLHILSITSTVIEHAIRLRQQRKRSLGDAIIAATALIHNLPVVTNNVDDFSTVDGLTVISLTDILTGRVS
jgi:predicted nucleic acid-binding protein